MITLPTTAPTNVSWQPLDFGGSQSSPLGGATQRVNRLGNRWSVKVDLPPLERDEALEWSVALTKGNREGVAWKIWQGAVPNAGTPLVNGGSQNGATLACDGFGNGFFARVGTFFAINTGGQRYLHQVAANTASASGAFAALPIEPPLRVSPADNASLEFAAPYIEGLLADVPAWGYEPDLLGRGFSFTIEESR